MLVFSCDSERPRGFGEEVYVGGSCPGDDEGRLDLFGRRNFSGEFLERANWFFLLFLAI